MPKAVLYLIATALAGTALWCVVSGGVILVVTGVVLFVVAAVVALLAVVAGRDPQDMVNKLTARREELERRVKDDPDRT